MARDDEMSATIARLLDLATAEIDAPYRLPGTPEDVVQSPTSWLWEGYMLRGKPTLIDAPGESGKTRLVLAVAACATLGTFPFGYTAEPARAEPCPVLYLSNEDDLGEIFETFRELGGNLKLFNAMAPSRFGSLEGKGLAELTRTIEASRVGMLVLDPALQMLPSYVRTQFDNIGITKWLSELRDLTSQTGVALVLVRHWAKGGAGREAHEAGAGGEAWRNGARGQLVLFKHPRTRRDWFQCLVLPARNTLRVQYADPFAIEIKAGMQTFVRPEHVELEPYIEAYPHLAKRFPGAAAAMEVGFKGRSRGPDATAQYEAAKAILSYVRTAGGRARFGKVKDALIEDGHAKPTIYRARKELISAGALVDDGGYWCIPYDPATDTADMPGEGSTQGVWWND